MKLRSVNTEIWIDSWFTDVLSPNQKLLWFNLITNKESNLLGIFRFSTKRAALETGLELQEVKDALHFFIKEHKIKFIGEYIILKNHLKNNNYNTNMKKSVISSFNDIPENIRGNIILHKDDVDRSILFIKNIEKIFSDKFNDSATIRNDKRTIRRLEEEVEEEYELESEIENEASSSVFDKFLKIFLEFFNNKNPKFPYKENDREDEALKEISNYYLKVAEGDVENAINLWQITLDSYDKWEDRHKNQLTLLEITRNLPNILNKLTNVAGNNNNQSKYAQSFEALHQVTEQS